MKRPPESILEPMFNLVCAAGHRHYSPNKGRWYRRECLYVIGEKQKCRFKLRAL